MKSRRDKLSCLPSEPGFRGFTTIHQPFALDANDTNCDINTHRHTPQSSSVRITNHVVYVDQTLGVEAVVVVIVVELVLPFVLYVNWNETLYCLHVLHTSFIFLGKSGFTNKDFRRKSSFPRLRNISVCRY